MHHLQNPSKQSQRHLTTLLVSHRVSTARHADRIIVLDEGKIIEIGSHQALLESNGFYADLEKAQRVKGSMLEQLESNEAKI